MFMIRKYKYYGQWTEWKVVSREVAERKNRVRVGLFYPYQIKEIKD